MVKRVKRGVLWRKRVKNCEKSWKSWKLWKCCIEEVTIVWGSTRSSKTNQDEPLTSRLIGYVVCTWATVPTLYVVLHIRRWHQTFNDGQIRTYRGLGKFQTSSGQVCMYYSLYVVGLGEKCQTPRFEIGSKFDCTQILSSLVSSGLQIRPVFDNLRFYTCRTLEFCHTAA